MNEIELPKVELSQDNIVDLFIEKMKSHGSSHSGTYNKADPTHYEKGEAEIGFMYGFTAGEEDMCGCPGPENVKINWHDVTWGIEFEITTSGSIEKGYWSRPMFGSKGVWYRTTENFLEVFKRILLEGEQKDFWIADYCQEEMGINYR